MTRRALVLSLFVLGSLLVPLPTAQAAITTTAGQSTYLPQDPVRVLDTRNGTGGSQGAIGNGGTFDLSFPNRPTGATSVTLNVTAVGATRSTNVRVYPRPANGTDLPHVSNLNVEAGITVANLVTVQLGVGGDVRLRNAGGSVHLVVDLAGYYVAGAQGAGFTATTPVRLVDTRPSGSPLRANQPRTVDLGKTATGGASPLPTDATAVVLNVTAVSPSANTVVRVYPAGAPPTVSNLNPRAGDVVAALVVVKVEEVTDTVRVLSGAGVTDLVVDLQGWFTPDRGSVFHPVSPFRLLDTRTTSRVVAGAPRALAAAGSASLPWMATAISVNLTAVLPDSSTNVTLYPLVLGQSDRPTASNVNLRRGQTVPNAAVVATGAGGAVRLANASRGVHLVLDIAGWYGPAGDGWDISWPQCTSAGATTSRNPNGGAFAVIGVTKGVFGDNTCLASEWAWASSLPSPPSVYLNTDANTANPHWSDRGPRPAVCSAQQIGGDCGYNYGWNLASYAAPKIPRTPDGGLPFVWLDVEGPYSNGPYWTKDVTTNRGVVVGAVVRLRNLGYRVGIYSDRATSSFPDWTAIMGRWTRPEQNWVFRAPDANASALCRPAESFSGGPVVMVQVQPQQSGQAYDVNHAC